MLPVIGSAILVTSVVRGILQDFDQLSVYPHDGCVNLSGAPRTPSRAYGLGLSGEDERAFSQTPWRASMYATSAACGSVSAEIITRYTASREPGSPVARGTKIGRA